MPLPRVRRDLQWRSVSLARRDQPTVRVGSESEGVAEFGLDAGFDGELVDLLGLAGELLLFPGEVGFEAAVEFGSEGSVGVGDVVEGSELLDGAGGTLPCGPMFGIVGNGAEAAGEVAGRVLGGRVAADANVGAQLEV